MAVIGVTAATIPEDKRGVATNLAAFAAAAGALGTVVVVDADPTDADVGVRLGVTGPDVARVCTLSAGVSGSALLAVAGRLAWPPLRVITARSGGALAASQSAALRSVLDRLRPAADLVVVDIGLLAPPIGRAAARGVLGALDSVVVATNPEPVGVAATRGLLDALLDALGTTADRGWLRSNMTLRVAVTGDEGSAVLDPREVAAGFGGQAVVLPQLWGRMPPNFGFGPTLEVAPIDGACAALLGLPAPERSAPAPRCHVP